MSVIISILKVLPKNLLSFICGFISRLRLPILNRLINKLFVSFFNIDLDEAELPLSSYGSVEDVFTRKLKPDARPIQGRMSSPADGFLSESGPVKNQTAVQVKGIEYSLSELVTGVQGYDSDFNARWFTTIYLAPHNYHRVHSPCAGQLVSILHVSGKLWPVNSAAVHSIPALFNKNERLIFEILTENSGTIFVVMVGAFNVGRISTPFWPDFVSNSFGRQWRRSGSLMKKSFSGITIEQGQELGVFMLGSTVVLVYTDIAKEDFNFNTSAVNKPIRLGENLEQAVN